MIYDETDIPHKNLLELKIEDNLNNNNLMNQINSDNVNKELLEKEQQYEKQKEQIKLLQMQIQSCNNQKEIENLKSSIYEEISFFFF